MSRARVVFVLSVLVIAVGCNRPAECDCDCEQTPPSAPESRPAEGEGAPSPLGDPAIVVGQDGIIALPPAEMTGGLPLMQALAARTSQRAFAEKPIGMQTLSNLMWAATGINRPDSGKLTAPTAVNWQQIDVYVALEQGLFVYQRKDHTLVRILVQDIRAETGEQEFVGTAPVELVFVSETSRMEGCSDEKKPFYSATDTGFVSQNVYLFCASAGLATVVRGMVDREKLHPMMGLAETQIIVLAQTVGYPAG